MGCTRVSLNLCDRPCLLRLLESPTGSQNRFPSYPTKTSDRRKLALRGCRTINPVVHLGSIIAARGAAGLREVQMSREISWNTPSRKLAELEALRTSCTRSAI